MSLTLSVLLASASVPALASVPAPGSPAIDVRPRRAIEERMSLDLASLEPLDPRMRADLARLIHAEAAAVIAKHAVPASKIHLAIGWQNAATFDYSLALEIDAHDGMPAQADRRPTGADTEQSELGDVVEAALERQLGAWTREHDRAIRVASSRRIVTPPPPRAKSVRRALGPMGWTGVAVAIAGAAGMGTGIGLLVRDPTPHPTDETKLRTWKPGGIAFATVGGAALVTGVALAVIDGRRRSRAAVAPLAGRRTVGVSLRIAF